MLRLIPALCICLIAANSACAQAVSHSTFLHLADRIEPEAQLSDVTDQGLTWLVAGQSQTVSASQLVRWSSGRPVSPNSCVALADGSWLAGSIQWHNERKLVLASKWFEKVELNLDEARALLLNTSPSWSETQLLQQQMLTPTGSPDVLWKRDGQSAAGILTITMKPSIAADSAPAAALKFKAQSTTVASEVDVRELAGVTFSPILRPALLDEANCYSLTLIDGSRLFVRHFQLLPDKRLLCLLASGLTLTTLDESTEFTQAISAVHANPSTLTWLSDLEPARYRLLDPSSKVPWPLGRNRDLFGKPLFDQSGQAIEHALVIHAAAQVAYRRDELAKRLLGEVQLLPQPSSGASSRRFGSVQCQVLVARGGQLVKAWQSEILRVGQPAVALDVDVTQSQLIVLLVEPADAGTLGDHVLWRDLRLTK